MMQVPFAVGSFLLAFIKGSGGPKGRDWNESMFVLYSRVCCKGCALQVTHGGRAASEMFLARAQTSQGGNGGSSRRRRHLLVTAPRSVADLLFLLYIPPTTPNDAKPPCNCTKTPAIQQQHLISAFSVLHFFLSPAEEKPSIHRGNGATKLYGMNRSSIS